MCIEEISNSTYTCHVYVQNSHVYVYMLSVGRAFVLARTASSRPGACFTCFHHHGR